MPEGSAGTGPRQARLSGVSGVGVSEVSALAPGPKASAAGSVARAPARSLAGSAGSAALAGMSSPAVGAGWG